MKLLLFYRTCIKYSKSDMPTCIEYSIVIGDFIFIIFLNRILISHLLIGPPHSGERPLALASAYVCA